jgi:hypothetical protein
MRRASFLHVANGTSVTSLIEAAAIPGRRSIWADPLYEGPVPEGFSDEQLIAVRARYLAGKAGTGARAIEEGLRQWRREIAEHAAYDELVLWYEHDLFDQLNLIQLLPWIRAHVPPSKPVTLICIDRFPGHPDFMGIGELSADEIATLVDTRRAVEPSQYEWAEQAWSAFRGSTPERLESLAHAEHTAMPFLAPALRRLLADYPAARDGLSRTERRLLALAEHAPIALFTAFRRMHDDELYHITDLSFLALIRELATAPTPLLAASPPLTMDAGIPQGTLSTTEAGRAVLQGRADRIDLCGIDRWIGGVHLEPDGRLWRWDGDAARLVPPRGTSGGSP